MLTARLMKARRHNLIVKIIFMIMVAFGFSIFCSSANAQYGPDDVKRQLLADGIVLLPNAEITHINIDRLSGGTYRDIYFHNLQEGREYLFIAECDRDCQLIEMELWNNYQKLLATEKGATAIIWVRPGYTGTFVARISIPECRTSRCTYGVAAFGQR